MIRILGKSKTKVRIGYTTHNGHEFVVCTAPNREFAGKACAYGIAMAATNKGQASAAKAWLRGSNLN